MQFENFDYRLSLKQNLEERKMRNSSYSLRSFARDLDISITALSQVLSKKRDFSLINLKKVSNKLCWSPLQEDQAKKSIKKNATKSLENEKILTLSEDMFSLLSEWYYIALLNLTKQTDCSNQPSCLGKKLGVPTELIKSALERLKRLNLIKVKNNKLIRTSEPIRTTLDISSTAIRKYHIQNLNLAQHALENVPVEKREVSSITMNIDPDQMEQAKKMIVDFKRKFAKVMEKGDPQKTYTLTVHFFPSTLAKEE